MTTTTQAVHRHPSPLGELGLSATGRGLTAVRWPNALAAGRDAPAVASANPVVRDAARQLDAYFAGRLRGFELPLDPSGTDFQLAVWAALAEIPVGETISYGELAAGIGQPGAARAVGGALGANPTPIVVACHRVVTAEGELGGFGGGRDVKRWLLDHEGAALAAGSPT